MAIIDCPECAHKISDQSVACTNCGLPTSQMTFSINCPECSESVSNKSVACTNCGFPIAKPAPLKNTPPPIPTQNHTTIVQVHSSRKSKGVAIVLAVFLVGF